MGRMVLAVVAGFVLWSVLWVVAGQVVLAIAPGAYGDDGRTVASPGIFVLFLFVAAVLSVVSGWLAATLGRAQGRRAGAILALVLLAVGLVVEIASWGMAPVWYHLVFLGLLVPATVGGAALQR